MPLLQKIKASALQMVLVVAVIIVILLFAFISLMYFQKRMAIKHANYTESVYKNHQVFDYLKRVSIPMGITDSIDGFSGVRIVKKQWGIFDLIRVGSKINREYFEQIALVGESNLAKKALYLKSNNQQLILVGNTTIKGDVALPSNGVNGGNIAGVSYAKDKFVYGNISQSTSEIPRIRNIDKTQLFLTTYINDTIEEFNLDDYSTLHRSFTKKTLVHRSNELVDMVDATIEGNIIIASATRIKVHASAVLNNVILIAPEVEIMNNFSGSVQVFATKKIRLGMHSQLAYPSSLVLLEDANMGSIRLEQSSIVKGIVGYLSDSIKKQPVPQVIIEDMATVTGEVYCNGYVELKGVVEGAVYAHNFIVNKFGGVYINHILNGTINADILPSQYAGLFIENSSKTVAKWLN